MENLTNFPQNPKIPEFKNPENQNENQNEINWVDKRKRNNEKRRERRRQKEEGISRIEEKRNDRQKQKERDPEYTHRESKKRQERRLRQEQNLEKSNYESQNRQIINDAADKLFYENKHTFPNPISKTKWENMKRDYINFLFGEEFSPGENTLKSLMEDRRRDIKSLQENPNYPCAASIIFFIKTLVPYPKDNARKLTQGEIDWLNSQDTTSPEKTKKCYGQKEYKREKSKVYYENKKMEQKNTNLNLRFIKADPNRVLSIDEITNDPFVSNFPIREKHKIDLWKADENLEDLDKWRKQYEDYVLEVESLSIEYKENFLKINGGSNSCGNV